MGWGKKDIPDCPRPSDHWQRDGREAPAKRERERGIAGEGRIAHLGASGEEREEVREGHLRGPGAASVGARDPRRARRAGR